MIIFLQLFLKGMVVIQKHNGLPVIIGHVTAPVNK